MGVLDKSLHTACSSRPRSQVRLASGTPLLHSAVHLIEKANILQSQQNWHEMKSFIFHVSLPVPSSETFQWIIGFISFISNNCTSKPICNPNVSSPTNFHFQLPFRGYHMLWQHFLCIKRIPKNTGSKHHSSSFPLNLRKNCVLCDEDLFEVDPPKKLQPLQKMGYPTHRLSQII